MSRMIATLDQCRRASRDVRAALSEVQPSIVIRSQPAPSRRREGSLLAYEPLATEAQREALTKAVFLWLLREFGPEFEATCATCRTGKLGDEIVCQRYPVGAMLALGSGCEP